MHRLSDAGQTEARVAVVRRVEGAPGWPAEVASHG